MGSIIKTITFYERPFWREKGKTPFQIDLLTPGINKFERVSFETKSIHQTALRPNLSWKACILFILTTLWCFFVTNKKQIKRNRERFGDFLRKAGLDSTRSLLHHPFLYYCQDCVCELSMINVLLFFFLMKYPNNFSILCKVHWIIQSVFLFKVLRDILTVTKALLRKGMMTPNLTDHILLLWGAS